MTDLKNLLDELAHDGTVAVDESDLLRRIRRRRRTRSALFAASGVATVAVVAAGAYAALPAGTTNQPGPAASTTAGAKTTVTAFPVAPFHCGDAFPAPGSGPKLKLIATVTLTNKSMSRTAGGWSGRLRSEFRFNGGLPHPLIAGSPPRWAAVVRDGRMVAHATISTTGKPVELRPGQSHVVDAGVEIRSCPGEQPAAGSYLLYEDLDPTAKLSRDLAEIGPIGRLQLP